MPGNHSAAPLPGSDIACTDDRPFGAHSLYNDDGGTTWHLGGVDTTLEGVVNPNENTVVELSDGTLYFNARDQYGTSVGARASTISSDGGATFDAPYQEVTDIVAPVVQGSILGLSRDADRRERLLFAAPGHPTARENLTLWSSFDDAGSWVRGPVVYEGPAGYSDLVQIDGRGNARRLGVFYENGDRLGEGPTLTYHQRISFARVIVPTLDAPSPPPATTPACPATGSTQSSAERPGGSAAWSDQAWSWPATTSRPRPLPPSSSATARSRPQRGSAPTAPRSRRSSGRTPIGTSTRSGGSGWSRTRAASAATSAPARRSGSSPPRATTPMVGGTMSPSPAATRP